MNRTIFTFIACTAIPSILTASMASAGGHKFLNFDVPGASNTFPSDINDSNDVAGHWGASPAYHGFLRTSDGIITTFDAPQAASTVPLALNEYAEIAGYFYDSASVSHGFLRLPDGTITAFDPRSSTSTLAEAINNKGQITGSFVDSNGKTHGFVRKAGGKFVIFDVDGAVLTYGQEINDKGAVAGVFCTNNLCNPIGAFIRAADGAITPFTVQDAQRTLPAGINAKGVIAGGYSDCCGNGSFLRSPDGQIITFDGCGVNDLNNKGWIVGFNTDFASVNHGCLRAPDGTVTTFDDPDAGGGINQGTQPISINSTRYVTGYYEDSNLMYHGFIVQPRT